MRNSDLPSSRERLPGCRPPAALLTATGTLAERQLNACQVDPIVCRPSVCVVGSFPPRVAGGLPTQGEELAIHLREVCRRVEVVSRHPRRSLRLLHVAARLLLFARGYDTLCVQVYGRKALLLEATALLLGRAWGCRVVLHLHAGGLPAGLDRRPQPSRWLYRLADAAVCPSRYLQQEMARHGLQTTVIPNAIDPTHYPFRARRRIRPHLLWLRTFHPFYNPLLALRTYELVRRRYPDALLTMAGMDREYVHEVRRAAEAMALPVTFGGLIPRAEIPALMDAHDIYLNTPHVDNTPITVIEAMLCGLPVAATAVGGIPYLLQNEETGMLIGDDDAEAFAEAISRLVEDPSLAKRLSCNGRRSAEQLSWQNTLPLWAERTGSSATSVGPPEQEVGMNTAALQARRMEMSDLETVISIHLRTFEGYKSTLLGPRFVGQLYQWFLIREGAFGVVVEADDTVCGFAVGARLGSGPALTRFTAPRALAVLLSRPWLIAHPEIVAGFRLKLRQIRHPEPPRPSLPGAPDTPTAALAGIAVAPQQQGRGIGGRLVAMFETEAIRHGYGRAWLSVRRENTAACRLYERCGWKQLVSPTGSALFTYAKLLEPETQPHRAPVIVAPRGCAVREE